MKKIMGNKIVLVVILTVITLLNLVSCVTSQDTSQAEAQISELNTQLDEVQKELKSTKNSLDDSNENLDKANKRLESLESNEFLNTIFWSDGNQYYVRNDNFTWYSDCFCSQKISEEVILNSPCVYSITLSNGNIAYVAINTKSEIVWSTKRPSLHKYY